MEKLSIWKTQALGKLTISPSEVPTSKGVKPQPLTSLWFGIRQQHVLSGGNSITKLLMKNSLLRSNSMAWWMALSVACGLVSDLLCVSQFAFRAARKKMHSTERTSYPLFSDTKPAFYSAVVHRPWEIDTVSAAPKMNLCSPRKPLAQRGQSTRAPLLDWNAYAILSTFSGNDHSEWVMTAPPTLHHT